MTPAQEKFLREFAEKLGWERQKHIEHIQPGYEEDWGYFWCPPEDERGKYQTWEDVPEHLLEEFFTSPDGQAYLIQRAREDKWYSRLVYYIEEKSLFVVRLRRKGDMLSVSAHADTEPWATAIAVAKALFGMEGPE